WSPACPRLAPDIEITGNRSWDFVIGSVDITTLVCNPVPTSATLSEPFVGWFWIEIQKSIALKAIVHIIKCLMAHLHVSNQINSFDLASHSGIVNVPSPLSWAWDLGTQASFFPSNSR